MFCKPGFLYYHYACIINHIMRKIFTISAFLVSICSFCQTAPPKKGGGVFINPITIEFNLTNGQTGTNKITLTNGTSKKVRLNLYLNDWMRDTLGNHTYLPPSTVHHSCSNWISLDKTFVELESKETAEVNIKMHVPDSVSATKEMKWSMLFIETVREKVAPNPGKLVTAVNTDYRFGLHIYQTPPSLTNKDVKMLSFSPLKNGKNRYRIVCQNVGETQLTCNSYIELMNMADGKKTKIKPQLFPIFPEQKRYIDFTLPEGLAKGKYTLTGVVDAGNDVPLEAGQLIIDLN